MKKILLFLMAFIMSCHVLLAQQITVTGTVTDAADGSPAIGANVVVKGTVQGTAVNVDGKFSLNVPAERSVLIISSIGYKAQEITLNTGQRVLNVALEEDTELLSEVVVVGYGTMRKSDLSGASVTVGEEKIKGSIITNLDQALQGRAAGVTSVMTSGAPGSAVSINVRGLATINANSEPLYVVDGVIFQGGTSRAHDYGLGSLGNGTNTSISPLSTLNPADIVSMEILKDASATAIYGAQGSNGVVLITTKRGKAGDAKFSYEGMFGIQNQVVRLDMMNLRQYAEYNSAIAATTGNRTGTSEYLDPSLLGKGTDWQDAIFRQALMHQHNFSAQGGTEKVQYYISGSYMDQEGTIVSTEFSRYSFRANLDAQMKNWLKVGLNASYTNTDERLARAEGSEGVLTYSLLTPPDIPVYDVYGNYATVAREGYTRVNPIALAELNENLLERSKFIGNIYADISPIKKLTWHTELGFDIGGSRTEVWNPTYNFGAGTVRERNYLMVQRTNSLFWALKNYVTYADTRGKHNYSVMLGQELWESRWESQSVTGEDLPDNTVRNPRLGEDVTIGFGKSSSAMSSFFGRGTYNYDDRYMGTYTYRRDGSSNFGPKNRWANFHSFALSWRFSNEAFLEGMANALKMSNGKLRIGWGQTGNQAIGGYKWGASMSLMPSGLGNGYRQSNIANPYIKWETQEQWNLGLDLGFFHDRINLTVDMYDKTSKDMLMELQLPSYMGTRGNGSSALAAPWGNYGTINNKGLEITLNTRNFVKEFTWTTDFQISFNKNKLVALDGTAASALEGYGQWNDVVSRTEIGESLYGFYGYIVDGVYANEQEIREHLYDSAPEVLNRYQTVFIGDTKYRDIKKDGKITAEDRTNIGSPLPKFTFGMTNTFAYKNFDLSVFIHGSYGNKILNYIGRDLTNMDYWSNQLSDVMDFARIEAIDDTKKYPIFVSDSDGNVLQVNNWFEDASNVVVVNPNAKYPRGGQGLSSNHYTSNRHVEDGSYLRIKNITLGCTLPTRWVQSIRLENLRVYTSVQNLYTFTKYSGYDPEVGYNPQDSSGKSFGVDNGRYPSPRIISFGVNLSF